MQDYRMVKALASLFLTNVHATIIELAKNSTLFSKQAQLARCNWLEHGTLGGRSPNLLSSVFFICNILLVSHL